MMAKGAYPGAEAVLRRGWLGAYKWLLLRRFSQLSILALFLAGPWFGVWIVKGNLASSLTLDVLPLTDPFVLLQTLATRHWPELTALIGALIVIAFYVLVGGRVYCGWVCPVNLVTDAAAWLRRRLGIKSSVRITRSARYWLLGVVFVLAAVSGVAAWEFINPVMMTQRAIIFGVGFAWIIVLAVFLFDLFVAERGWCGHVCPQGAFYSLLAVAGVIRVTAAEREQCDDCTDCYIICPEPHVIKPALKGADKGIGPVILSPNCTNCGRCIDVCSRDVFRFATRFDNRPKAGGVIQEKEATP
jgi:ferredoxin-type protein NapH